MLVRCHLKNRKGITLLELMAACGLAAMGILVFSSGIISIYKRLKDSGLKSENQIALATLALQISHVGKLSRGCVKITSPKLSLECAVEFIAGTNTLARFEFDPGVPPLVPPTLTYSRDGKIYQKTIVAGFSVCTGNEILNSNCPETDGTAWDNLQNISLANYFRFKVTVENKMGKAFIDSGFVARNAGTPMVSYKWTSWGGTK